MRIECRPKYYKNSYIIRDYIIAFTFNNKKYGVSYHSKIINLLIHNPNFNLIFFLIIKLGFYLKELQIFILSTFDGKNKVFMPIDYYYDWNLVRQIISKLCININLSHPEAINNPEIKPNDGVQNKDGFFLESKMYKRNEYYGNYKFKCINQNDKKTYGYYYNHIYSYKCNYKIEMYFVTLFDKIVELCRYIIKCMDIYNINDDELKIVNQGLNIIFNKNVNLNGHTFLRGLFCEYKAGDTDEIIVVNHLKILELDPLEFIEKLKIQSIP